MRRALLAPSKCKQPLARRSTVSSPLLVPSAPLLSRKSSASASAARPGTRSCPPLLAAPSMTRFAPRATASRARLSLSARPGQPASPGGTTVAPSRPPSWALSRAASSTTRCAPISTELHRPRSFTVPPRCCRRCGCRPAPRAPFQSPSLSRPSAAPRPMIRSADTMATSTLPFRPPSLLPTRPTRPPTSVSFSYSFICYSFSLLFSFCPLLNFSNKSPNPIQLFEVSILSVDSLLVQSLHQAGPRPPICEINNIKTITHKHIHTHTQGAFGSRKQAISGLHYGRCEFNTDIDTDKLTGRQTDRHTQTFIKSSPAHRPTRQSHQYSGQEKRLERVQQTQPRPQRQARAPGVSRALKEGPLRWFRAEHSAQRCDKESGKMLAKAGAGWAQTKGRRARADGSQPRRAAHARMQDAESRVEIRQGSRGRPEIGRRSKAPRKRA
eukprot:m.115406 g.115406  ORF g.115406 m.115406 type:complete len:440 (+) comp14449_c0_seq3:1054-2373(+)